MPHYILRPKKDFLKRWGDLDVLTEGNAVFGILTDKYRFPETRESIEEYTIRVPEKTVEIKLKIPLDRQISRFLERYWDIIEI